jgi:hypothetical protein
MPTIRFPFTTDLAIGGVRYAEVEGWLELSPDSAGCSPHADHASWTVDEIHLNGRTGDTLPFADATVEIPDDHPLHDALLVQVINERRAEIDDFWARELTERIGAARRRFRLIA